jgi:membrane protein DedA with SNARE-associated domain
VLQDWIHAINDWVPMLAGSPWVYLALFAFAAIDGFFPPIPSESVVIALASLSIAHGEPNIVLVALAGAAGAFTGDQIAYMIGSKVDVRRLRIFRTGRGAQALDWAEHALVHRGSSFILAARYIPIGRVAVNMTAGALGYPRRRFVGLTALAAATWAAYGTLIGAGAGAWLADHSLLAVVAGVVIGTVVGLGIDWALRRWTRVGEAPARLDNGREEPEVVVEHPASADGGTEAVDPPATEPTAAPVTSRQRSDPGR